MPYQLRASKQICTCRVCNKTVPKGSFIFTTYTGLSNGTYICKKCMYEISNDFLNKLTLEDLVELEGKESK